jgi:Zn-dependent peptidase ImmA (M78 family)
MNKKPPLDSAGEIERITRNILLASKAWDKFPTPVDTIAQFAQLQIEMGVDLATVEPGFLTKNFQFAKRALSKVVGLVDFRQKKIYLDHTLSVTRKNFVKLHEVGHEALSWQSAMKGFMDDDQTLDPLVDELFEREASSFASASLFQLERFEDELAKLPLSIKSAQVLGQKFGGSCHAAIRRYVERSPKRCALLVLNKPQANGTYTVGIRDYFQSPAFTVDFGEIIWASETCGLEWKFVQEIKRGRKLHEDGQVALVTGSGETVTFNYHFFNSTHNTFILFLPAGEQIKSRVTILQR